MIRLLNSLEDALKVRFLLSLTHCHVVFQVYGSASNLFSCIKLAALTSPRFKAGIPFSPWSNTLSRNLICHFGLPGTIIEFRRSLNSLKDREYRWASL